MSEKVRITTHRHYDKKSVEIYRTAMPNDTARLAFALLEKWGPVCAMPDGEDSAGRAKIRPLTPNETVVRAFEIAEFAMQCAWEGDHMIELPDVVELNREAKTADGDE